MSVPSAKCPNLLLAYLGQRAVPVFGAERDGKKDARGSGT